VQYWTDKWKEKRKVTRRTHHCLAPWVSV